MKNTRSFFAGFIMAVALTVTVIAVDKIADYVNNIVKSEVYKASVNAVVTPTPLPN